MGTLWAHTGAIGCIVLVMIVSLVASWYVDRTSVCEQSRCQELSEELQKHRKQLDVLNTELLAVVQQKLTLQQQNEAWQVRMDAGCK